MKLTSLPVALHVRGRPRPDLLRLVFVPAFVAVSVVVSAEERRLSLDDVRRLVVENNWNVQAKALDYEAKRRVWLAEKGIFDPAAVASYDHEDRHRPNTVQQQRELSGVPEFDQRNNLYSSGLQTLTPLGGKVNLLFSISDLRNNLQALKTPSAPNGSGPETVTFAGVTLSQPLLRDAGWKATTAALRVAATESNAAFQEYRRQMMMAVSSAELAYGTLYGAQRQMAFFGDSIDLAEQMRQDAETEVKAEKSPPLKLTQAQAGVEERRGKFLVARQKRDESMSQLANLCGLDVTQGMQLVAVNATPSPRKPQASLGEGLEHALLMNPDYLAKQSALETEAIRTDYARNQKLPQLNLKATAGLNGLGDAFGTSYDDIRGSDFPEWTVGVELKVPLGNREAENRYQAALARKLGAEGGVSDARRQLANGLQLAIRKLQNAYEGLGTYQSAVKYNKEILDSSLVELKEGKTELRKVLEAEQDLAESRVNSLQADVSYFAAVLEYDLATGQTLEKRGLETTKEDLARKTTELVRSRFPSQSIFARYMQDLRKAPANESGERPAPPPQKGQP